MDRIDIFFKAKGQQSRSKIDSPIEGGVLDILTIWYNAWKYRNELEAFAGMAMEITMVFLFFLFFYISKVEAAYLDLNYFCMPLCSSLGHYVYLDFMATPR